MGSIRDLTENQQNLEDHLEEMEQCILEEELFVAKSNEKINRNTNLLNLSVSMCAAFREEHAAATASRNEELELLATVRKMVRRRLDGLGSSVVSRDDSFRTTLSLPTTLLSSLMTVVTRVTLLKVSVLTDS